MTEHAVVAKDIQEGDLVDLDDIHYTAGWSADEIALSGIEFEYATCTGRQTIRSSVVLDFEGLPSGTFPRNHKLKVQR